MRRAFEGPQDVQVERPQPGASGRLTACRGRAARHRHRHRYRGSQTKTGPGPSFCSDPCLTANAPLRKRCRQVIQRNVAAAPGGKLPIATIGRDSVAYLHHSPKKMPISAGSIRGGFVTKYRTRRIERFATEEAFRRIGETLDGLQPPGAAPGAWRGGIPAADADRMPVRRDPRPSLGRRAPGEKREPPRRTLAGPRTVPLSSSSARVLSDLPRPADNPWAIAGRKPGTQRAHISCYLGRVRPARRAGRRADSRSETQPCLKVVGARRAASDDRQAARALQDSQDGASCPSRARF